MKEKARYKFEYYKNNKSALQIISLDLKDSIEEQNQFRNLFYPFDLYLYKEVYLDENYDIIEEREYEENGGQRNSKLS